MANQAFDTAELDAQLGELLSDADGHFQADRQTHKKLHNLLARAYLWWRAAGEKPEYTESVYHQRHIKYHSTGNEPKFNPLIRLVWNIREPTKGELNTISQWARCLEGLHERYCERPEEFGYQPVEKLVAFIEKKDNQGRTGVWKFAKGGRTKKKRTPIDDTNDPLSDAAKEDLARLAIAALQSSPGIGFAVLTEPLRVGNDGLGLLVVKGGVEEKHIVVGSSNDPEDIRKACVNAVRDHLTGLPPHFRAIVETISTQTFPEHALPSSPEQRAKWIKEKYAEPTPLWSYCTSGCQPKGPKSRTFKGLLVRPDKNEILLSHNMTFAAPVTRCIPNEPVFGQDAMYDAMYLRVSDLYRIERSKESGKLPLFWGGEEKVENLGGDGRQAAYALVVSGKTTGSSLKLCFYGQNAEDDILHTKGEFDRESFRPDWTVRLTPAWFGNVRQVWGDRWFFGLGRFNHITRPHNAVLGLEVDADAISIIFNRENGSERFELPERIEGHGQRYPFSSKDLAPVLMNLADVQAIDGMVVSGNRHAILFQYETPVGLLETAIPTLRENLRTRDDAMYRPVDYNFPVELTDE